jgi:hypothetical protein
MVPTVNLPRRTLCLKAKSNNEIQAQRGYILPLISCKTIVYLFYSCQVLFSNYPIKKR